MQRTTMLLGLTFAVGITCGVLGNYLLRSICRSL
jgi:hypothetical protein